MNHADVEGFRTSGLDRFLPAAERNEGFGGIKAKIGKLRKQFGQAIGSFQALQHRMADLLLEIEQARSAVINAASALDADRITRERSLSAAKASISSLPGPAC